MRRIRSLEGVVRSYAWGSRMALAELQGRPAPAPAPEAELWFGAHPAAPSRIRTDGGWVPLPEWIARDPHACLGDAVAERFGGELPFLVKVLAVGQPLSLQVHPDAGRAREGFERENRARIPVDGSERSYRDPRHKPELVCALTRFTALQGFRPLEELCDRLKGVGLADQVAGFASLRRRPGREAWRTTFRCLLALDGARRQSLLASAAAAAAASAGADPALEWVTRLARAFPDDVGALAPLFLNLVVLEPGQALFLPPGQLHCYLAGMALEVMASSDNVLRAGLTEKHVDAEELVRVAEFAPHAPRCWAPGPISPTESRYPTQAEEFQLSAIQVGADTPHVTETGGSAEVLVCAEGKARVVEAHGSNGLVLTAGTGAFVPAAARGHRVEGKARLFRVTVPPVPCD